jgi:hypothetical protein
MVEAVSSWWHALLTSLTSKPLTIREHEIVSTDFPGIKKIDRIDLAPSAYRARNRPTRDMQFCLIATALFCDSGRDRLRFGGMQVAPDKYRKSKTGGIFLS